MTATKTLFCGDTFLRTGDGEDPFAEIGRMVQDAWVCLNLETALKGDWKKSKNVVLSVDETSLDWLPDAVRVVTIVNNHTADSGDPERLARELTKRGKTVIGPDNPARASAELNGVTVEFFSAYFSLPRFRLSYRGRHAQELVRMLSESTADRRIVNLHWGYENADVPAPFQRDLAHRLVDAGADIIIGHHPHVPQGWEIYRDKHIYYSLGNFNFAPFDAVASERNRWGYMVEYDLNSGSVIPVPYRINDNYQPHPVPKEERERLLAELDRLSEDLRNMGEATWFNIHYDTWYAHEKEVWKRRCQQQRSAPLWLKLILWLCMPMQWKYRFYTAAGRLWRLCEHI